MYIYVYIYIYIYYHLSGMWDNLISDSLDVGFHLPNISEVRNFWTSRM